MTPANDHRPVLDARRYLLGDGDDQQIQAFEVRLLAEPELETEVAEAEEQLIDDYARNTLSEREQALMHRNFLTPARRGEIELTQFLLRESDAAREQPVMPLRTASPKIWMWAAAAAVVGGVVGTLIGAVVVRDRAGRALQVERTEHLRDTEVNGQRIEDQQAQMARLEEALRLASASDGVIITVDSSVRAPEPTVLQLPADAQTIRLAFGVPEGRHAAYHITIIANDGASYREIWSADVPATSTRGRVRAIVSVPREALVAGRYVVQVTGRLPDTNKATEFALRIP